MAKANQVRRLGSGTRSKGVQNSSAKSKRGAARAQAFVVRHANQNDFKAGLRGYAAYRDLGIKEATGGLAQAHVIRFVHPSDPSEMSKPHYHDVDFQMVYVLKGWYETDFEGHGRVVMREGSAWV